MLTYFGFKFGLLIARFFPVRRFGDLLARAAVALARLSPSRRRLVNENLALLTDRGVVPPPDSDAVFAAYGRYWGEFLSLAARPGRYDALPFRVEGRRHLDAALASGSVCLVSGHVANWDLLAFWVRRQMPEFTATAERLNPRPLFDLFVDLRRRFGVRVIGMEKAGISLYRLMKQGRAVGLLVDRVIAGLAWREAPFLGGRRRFPAEGMDLARRAGATLLPIFLVRGIDDYVIKIFPPLDVEADPVTAFAAVLEGVVREHPEQWCLLYPYHDTPEADPQPQARAARRSVAQ